MISTNGIGFNGAPSVMARRVESTCVNTCWPMTLVQFCVHMILGHYILHSTRGKCVIRKSRVFNLPFFFYFFNIYVFSYYINTVFCNLILSLARWCPEKLFSLYLFSVIFFPLPLFNFDQFITCISKCWKRPRKDDKHCTVCIIKSTLTHARLLPNSYYSL